MRAVKGKECSSSSRSIIRMMILSWFLVITGLVLLESSLAVVISNGIRVLLSWGLIIVGLLVGRGLVSGGRVVEGGPVSRGMFGCGSSGS